MHKQNRNSWYFAGFAMLVFTILGVSIYMFLSSSSSFTLKNEYFQVGAGEKVVFEKGEKLTYEESYTTYASAKNHEVLATSPLYEKDGSSFLLPRDLIYVDARAKAFYRADHFSEFQVTDEQVLWQDKNQKGFLYDGFQQYVFLEPMTLKINGKEVSAAAGSSITINIATNAYIFYEKGSDLIDIDQLYTQSMEASCNDYRIELLNGILYVNDEKILLYSNVDDLESIS